MMHSTGWMIKHKSEREWRAQAAIGRFEHGEGLGQDSTILSARRLTRQLKVARSGVFMESHCGGIFARLPDFWRRDSSHKYGVVKVSVNGNNSRSVATLAVRQSSVPKRGCARRNVRADGSKRKCAARRSSTRPRYCCCVTQQRYRSRARTFLLPTGIARVAGILRAPPSGIYQILCQLLDDVAQFQRLQPAFRNTRCAPKGAKDLPG